MPSSPSICIYPDAREAAWAGAESFALRAGAAVRDSGRFSVALSGGSGPVEMYRLMGEEPFRSAIPWEGVHLFWGDERCVPPGHHRSNYGMAHEAFISRVPVPPENVHRMRGELPAAEGARRYAEELAAFFGPGIPRLDLVHLGMGPDGHTASLFPFSPLLLERGRTVADAIQQPAGEPRITLTPPVLRAAARVEMLVTGAGKAAIVRTALRGPLDPLRIPAQMVGAGARPLPHARTDALTHSRIAWMLDAAAAAGITR
ncbi:MAG TPA: 6-phosphogluconolactonase [Longimicrobium sp.]|nr:6-phosphogluconolactonase [Longimicrobium sp.]